MQKKKGNWIGPPLFYVLYSHAIFINSISQRFELDTMAKYSTVSRKVVMALGAILLCLVKTIHVRLT